MKILHLEDNFNDAEMLASHLQGEWPDVEIHHVSNRAAFLAALSSPTAYDVVLADYNVPGIDVTESLQLVRTQRRNLPFILVSGTIGEERAIALMKAGANDYILKDRLDRLPTAITQAIRDQQHQISAELAESARNESEERWRLLVSALSEIVWIAGADGSVLDDNHSWSAFTGQTIAERSHGGSFNVIHPEDRERVRAAWIDATHRVAEFRCEYRLRRKDGEWRHIVVRAIPRRTRSGSDREWIGAGVDVTDVTDAREEAQRKEAKYRAIFDQASDGIIIVAPSGELVDANREACRLMGAELNALIGRNVASFVIPEQREKLAANFSSVDHRPGRVREFLMLRRDGSTMPVETSAVRLNDGRILAIVRDLTARRAGAERHALQAKLVEQARDAIILRDLDNVVRSWNHGAEIIYGRTEREVIGRPFVDTVGFDLKVFASLDQQVREQGDAGAEVEARHKSGQRILVNCRCTLIRDEQGRPTSILNIDTDITAQKEREAEAFRTERIESIGTLAGGIAHDLNNILAPIAMGASLLTDLPLEPRLKHVVGMIGDSVERAARLVRQILAFTRGDEGHPSVLHVRSIVRGVQEIAEETFPKNIAIVVDIPEATPLIRGDLTQLEQVVLNLCVNARDAMPSGGTLTITAESQTLDEQYAAMTTGVRPGPYAVLCVADTGAGISPDIIGRIFDPFFTTKERGQGTGLGLATSARIVQRLNGSIRVESKVGHGTTFRIFLPATPEAARNDPAAVDETALRGNGEMILVVDDEAAIRSATQLTLEHFNYQVVTAANGAEGVGAFAQKQATIRLVITDMMMPIMDGLSMVTALRQIRPDVPIIGISGAESTATEQRFRELNLKHFLPKPFSAVTLLKHIRQALGE